MASEPTHYDVVVVGAGFAGLYALHTLRAAGHSVRVFEAAPDVGGTWYWNRYPGARCDVESVDYSYSFSPELEQDWHWTARYATQPEILAYLQHVADRFDLRRDIQFETRVLAAHYDETACRWEIRTDDGDVAVARFVIMATGCLSTPQTPPFEGAEHFRGNVYHTATWPEHVNFAGQRVGIIGTGSTGIQVVPEVAAEAEHLYVFQRTPNFSLPANDHPTPPEQEQAFKTTYPERRALSRASAAGFPVPPPTRGAFDVGDEERAAVFEHAWEIGGNTLQLTFNDLLLDEASNAEVSEFIRQKIRAVVEDPEIAEALCPTDYPFGAKRVCKDTRYFETFNRPDVTLVNLRAEPIVAMSERGIRTAAEEYELDSIILATGFDAMTGTLLRIDIVGRDGIRLADEWDGGPQTLLGLMVAGLPNLFLVTGPGSPSVLTNMVIAIEQHVEWIARCIADLDEGGYASIEASSEAQSDWVAHVNEVASATLYNKARSWYVGANIPGKPTVFMPYVGGLIRYNQACEELAASGYKGCRLTRFDHSSVEPSSAHLDAEDYALPGPPNLRLKP